MTKTIAVVELGYYHPSQANWNYHVHMVIDDTGARLYKETFGGDERMRDTLRAKGYEVNVLSAGRGTGVCYKWGDIKQLPDIEQYAGKNWGEGSPISK